jgi:hypothetical protein
MNFLTSEIPEWLHIGGQMCMVKLLMTVTVAHVLEGVVYKAVSRLGV